MFSVIFPGQGSHAVGMAKEFYSKYDLFKKKFKEADEILNFPISKLILEGPKEKLDLTENTQPSIFLVSYLIYKLATEEYNLNLKSANYFAGHSLGEYTALTCANSLKFEETLVILKKRGKAMQDAVPQGKGKMIVVMGAEISKIENILKDNLKDFVCYIANDNSNHQIVISGLNDDIDKLTNYLDSLKIKNISLKVSAPFHCPLMSKASINLVKDINNLNFSKPTNKIVSNVTAKEIIDVNELPNLLLKQIESRVRWRESINFMINNKVEHFLEIGPGKILTNLVKRINKNIKVSAFNSDEDIKYFKI